MLLFSDLPKERLAELVQKSGAQGYVEKGKSAGNLMSQLQKWLA